MRSYLKVCLLLWIFAYFVIEVHAGQFLRTVALTGEQAPGMSGVNMGLIGDSLGQLPVINNAGQTAFLAYLVGTGVSYPDNRSVWLEDSGNFQMVVRGGNQMPNSSSDQKFSFLGNVYFDSSGHITFTDSFTSWSASAGVLSPRTVIQFDDNGISAKTGDTTQTLVQIGEHAPGTPDGVYFSGFGGFVAQSHDMFAFIGNLSGPGVTSENSNGLWTLQDGILHLVARSGGLQPVPNLFNPSPKFYNFQLFSFDMNSAGDILFGNNGLWKLENGSLRSVVRYFPGIPDPSGETDYYTQDATMNASGGVAFYGYSYRREFGIDFVRYGFWIDDGSGIRALGKFPNELYPWLQGSYSVNSFALNNAGQIAFIGAEDSGPWGLWVSDRSERWRQIVQIGDVLEVRPNVFRTVEWVEFEHESGLGLTGGRPSGFNDRGQLVFRAIFADGSMGVFVSDIGTIPEPSSASLIAVALVCGTVRRSLKPLAA